MKMVDVNGAPTEDVRKACAAIQTDDKGGPPSYFIKMGQSASNKGRLYNPFRAMAKADDLYRFDNLRGEWYYDFSHKVSAQAYESYTAFLQTKRNSYFRHAEGEVLNAAR